MMVTLSEGTPFRSRCRSIPNSILAAISYHASSCTERFFHTLPLAGCTMDGMAYKPYQENGFSFHSSGLDMKHQHHTFLPDDRLKNLNFHHMQFFPSSDRVVDQVKFIMYMALSYGGIILVCACNRSAALTLHTTPARSISQPQGRTQVAIPQKPTR